VIDAGIARPDPRFIDERSSPPRQEARSEPTFDPGRYTAPEGYDTHPELMREFTALAREFGLSQKNGARALDFYRRAGERAEQDYAAQLEANVDRLERELPAEHLQAARELINDERYTPREMREWLGRWGNHPAVATMLTRWAAAIRDGRY
jgi:hypothetical protein